jgi:hypothetical protein
LEVGEVAGAVDGRRDEERGEMEALEDYAA